MCIIIICRKYIFQIITSAASLTNTGLEVIVQSVTLVTRADGPAGGVLAVVRTAAVVVLAAVHDLHLNPCHKSPGEIMCVVSNSQTS